MWGFVLLRLRAHRLLIAAALLTVLLTTTVLAALAGFTSSVADAGIRRTLATTDAPGATLLLQRGTDYAGRAAADADARAVARSTFTGLPTTVDSLAFSDPYALPGSQGGDPDTGSLAALDRSRLRLLQGSWPGAGSADGTVQVAIPLAAAARLGVGPASGGVMPQVTVTLIDQLSKKPLRLRITGVYQVRDSTDRYWQLDPIGGRGRQISSGGHQSSYGPLLVDDATFANGSVPQYQRSWLLVPDFGGLGSGQLGSLARTVRSTISTLTNKGEANGGFSAVSPLPELLTQLQRTVLVARATLLVAVLQLCLLALMTLLLAARLLAEERESENALLRARGAAPRRLTLLAAAEAALLALPSAVLAPVLAEPLIRLLGSQGPLAGSGVRLDGPLPGATWWAALAGALASAAVVLGPTLVRARSWSEQRRGRTRRGAVPGILRGGVDLLLVTLAAAAYWQLEHSAGQGGGTGALTLDSQGDPSLDPVLIAAPTLALCAGAVLALRLIPFAAKIAERWSARGRGLSGALIGWQLSRQPQQSTGPILVLALAAAVGTLSLGQNATWQQSQLDQAAFNTGGDIRIASNDTPAFGQGGEYLKLPGVSAVVPVGRAALASSGGRSAELLALDTRSAAGNYPLRADLGTHTAAELLAPLADQPLPAAQRGVEVPGRPTAVVLDLSATLSAGTEAGGGPFRMTEPADLIRLEVTDRFGLSYQLAMQSLPTDGQVHPVPFDLVDAAGGGVPAYPLTVSRLTVTTPVSMKVGVRQTLDLHAVRGSTGGAGSSGADAVPPTGLTWAGSFDPGTFGDDLGQFYGPVPYTHGSLTGISPSSSAGSGVLSARIDSGVDHIPPDDGVIAVPVGTLTLWPTGSDSQTRTPLPAVADSAYLGSSNTHIGSLLTLPVGAGSVQVRIVASVVALPGTGSAAEQGLNGSSLVQGRGFAGARTDAYGGALLVDIAGWNRRAAAAQAEVLQPGEWWLSVASAPGSGARAAAALRSLPGVQNVYVRDEVAAGQQHDPLSTGPQAALLAAVALAVALAGVGFTADAVGAIRRRADEMAVLRALGTPRLLLARSTATELGLPVLVGVGVGLLLGELVTRTVMPLLVLTPLAARPVPDALTRIPGGPLSLLLLAIAALPLLVAALSGLRGADPARRLRQPEES